MPPKVAAAPRKDAPIGRSRKTDKPKKKGKRRRYKLNLKGWLKTPADWARFNAWAATNALPRKIPEPEVVIRPSKPLFQLRRRIQVLSQPHSPHDPSINCRLDSSISKAALKAKPSRRINKLAWPKIRLYDFGRDIEKISPAALKYEASSRIIEISQPRIVIPEECKSFEVSKSAMKHKTTERERQMALAKKLVECPDKLTEEELEELFTPAGIRKSALAYKFTSWMFLLSLPAYKSLKHRRDTDATTWKKMILQETEKRGKKALSEQKSRKDKDSKRGRKRKREEKEKAAVSKKETNEDEEKEETPEKGGEETTNKEKNTAEDKKAKRRKLGKNAWRFEPLPCKEDPFVIPKSALEGKVPPGVEKLAERRIHQDTVSKKNPFAVKKSALAATPSGRIEILAKPSRPRSPVEREPPREKNEYGMPIFEKPPYGKKLPKTKPYKMGEYKPREEKKIEKKRPIDPIVYQPTFDPCIYPRLARIQKRERKKAEKVLKKYRARKRREKKKEKGAKDGASSKDTKEVNEGEEQEVVEQDQADAREDTTVEDPQEEE